MTLSRRQLLGQAAGVVAGIAFTPRHLIAEVGVGQIMMGTDYPFPWTKVAVDHILDTPGLSDADRIAMLGGTAHQLLGIKPT